MLIRWVNLVNGVMHVLGLRIPHDVVSALPIVQNLILLHPAPIWVKFWQKTLPNTIRRVASCGKTGWMLWSYGQFFRKMRISPKIVKTVKNFWGYVACPLGILLLWKVLPRRSSVLCFIQFQRAVFEKKAKNQKNVKFIPVPVTSGIILECPDAQ